LRLPVCHRLFVCRVYTRGAVPFSPHFHARLCAAHGVRHTAATPIRCRDACILRYLLGACVPHTRACWLPHTNFATTPLYLADLATPVVLRVYVVCCRSFGAFRCTGLRHGTPSGPLVTHTVPAFTITPLHALPIVYLSFTAHGLPFPFLTFRTFGYGARLAVPGYTAFVNVCVIGGTFFISGTHMPRQRLRQRCICLGWLHAPRTRVCPHIFLNHLERSDSSCTCHRACQHELRTYLYTPDIFTLFRSPAAI